MAAIEGEKSVILYQDYGRIRFRLKEVLQARGMTRGRLADLIHTKYSVINRLWQGQTERLDCDVLARICYVLECEVSDVMEYEGKSPEKSEERRSDECFNGAP